MEIEPLQNNGTKLNDDDCKKIDELLLKTYNGISFLIKTIGDGINSLLTNNSKED